MNSKERMFNSLQGKEVDRVPVLSVNQTATYEQMEALQVFWPEANYQGEKMAALAFGAASVLGFDAVRAPFCQTIEAEALGCVNKDGGAKGLPSTNVHPYKIGEPPVMPDDFLQRARVPELIKAIKLLKEQAGDDVFVIGGVIGPFSIAASLIGVTDLLKNSFRKPHLIQPYLGVGEKAGTLLALELIKAGADAICIEDMMASMDMISPKIYREVVAPWEKKQIEQINSVPVIIHICGKLDEIIDDIAVLGVDGISVEPKVNAPEAAAKLKKYGRPIALIGGVDAVTTLYAGNIDTVKAEVSTAIKNGYDMIAPGCSIPPATTTASLQAMVEEAAAAAK